MKVAVVLCLVLATFAVDAHRHHHGKSRREVDSVDQLKTKTVEQVETIRDRLMKQGTEMLEELTQKLKEMFPESKRQEMVKLFKDSIKNVFDDIPDPDLEEMMKDIKLSELNSAVVKEKMADILGEDRIADIDEAYDNFRRRQKEINERKEAEMQKTLEEVVAAAADRAEISQNWVNQKFQAMMASLSEGFKRLKESLNDNTPEQIAKFRTIIDYVKASRDRALKGYTEFSDDFKANEYYVRYVNGEMYDNIGEKYADMWDMLVSFVEDSEDQADSRIESVKPSEVRDKLLTMIQKAQKKTGKLAAKISKVIEADTCEKLEKRLTDLYLDQPIAQNMISTVTNLCMLYENNKQKQVGTFVREVGVRARESEAIAGAKERLDDFFHRSGATGETYEQKLESLVTKALKQFIRYYSSVRKGIENKLDDSRSSSEESFFF